MANDYTTGALYSTSLPAGQRAYYEQLLLATLRAKAIFVPFCLVKEDFAARDTGQLVMTEVYDTDPNFEALSESSVWLEGQHLDSRKITLGLEIHGDTLKFSDYTELTNYWNQGDFSALVRGKMGQNVVDYLDILAMNAHLDAYTVNTSYVNGRANRFALASGDVYDPDMGGEVYTHMEEMGIPGIHGVMDGDGMSIVGLTAPRAIRDIRNHADVTDTTNKWWEVTKYSDSTRKLRNEAGSWDGVRYMKSNRLLRHNYGKVSAQTQLAADTSKGQGAKASVLGFTVGQSTSTRYVTVDDSSVFSVGDVVTIHSADDVTADGSGGNAPNLSDGSQEVRRIEQIDEGGANRLTFDRPLLKEHSEDDYVTLGQDLVATILLGGPAVAYGVGQRPTPLIPPKIDDLMMINRIGWRGFLKFQMIRPEWVHVIWSAAGSLSL